MSGQSNADLTPVTSTGEAIRGSSPRLTVGEVVTAALEASVEVLEAESRLEIARARRSQTAAFSGNPVVEGSALPSGAFALEARQPLSVLGEGRAAHRAARFEMEAAAALLRRARLEAAAHARSVWLDAVSARRATRLQAQGAELALRLRDAVQQQVEHGEAPLLSLRLARLTTARAAAALLEARREEAEALQRLSLLIRRPVDPETLPDDLFDAVPDLTHLGPMETEPIAGTRPASPTERAHDIASGRDTDSSWSAADGRDDFVGWSSDAEWISHRSDLAAARAAVATAEAELTRQRAGVLPPLELGAFVESVGPQTQVGPAIELSLPLFDRNQVGRAAARGQLAQSRAQLHATAARAHTELQLARARLQEARSLQAEIGADFSDEVSAALESIASGYRLGELSLTEVLTLRDQVLDGLRAVLALEEELVRARLDLLLALEDDALLAR